MSAPEVFEAAIDTLADAMATLRVLDRMTAAALNDIEKSRAVQFCQGLIAESIGVLTELGAP